MEEADLGEADLRGADLSGTILSRANLSAAILSRVDLSGAILSRADLSKAKFEKSTTLPDGTKWTPNTDMAHFTDSEHPDFWRPDAEQ